MYESLHNHTLISDGSQTHLEVLQTAEAEKFSVVAFTDHDVFPSASIMNELKAYAGPVTWAIGIELSCGLPEDLGGSNLGNLHMLGYFCDSTNPDLTGYLERLRASRYQRLSRQVDHLISLGFDISVQNCLDVAGVSAPGSFHVVKTLLQVPANVDLVEKLRAEMEQAAQTDERTASKYAKMMTSGPVQYPYALFMKAGSFKPMPKDTLGSDLADFDQAVALIRGAGGIAVLAHWYFHEDAVSRVYLESALVAGRLDGIETAVHNVQVGDADYSEQSDFLQDLATRTHCQTTVGADAHYAGDFDLFAASREGKASAGQYERLISRVHPNHINGNYHHV